MKKTRVINLFAGPGAGKSTTAAGLYYELKKLGASVELVREYVKDWAWESRKIDPLNQLYITGQQSYKESLLYGKVDIVITDSPILSSAYYQERYSGKSYMTQTILDFMNHAGESKGVWFDNYLLVREKNYVNDGRFESEEDAKDIDNKMADFLTSNSINFNKVSSKGIIDFVVEQYLSEK